MTTPAGGSKNIGEYPPSLSDTLAVAAYLSSYQAWLVQELAPDAAREATARLTRSFRRGAVVRIVVERWRALLGPGRGNHKTNKPENELPAISTMLFSQGWAPTIASDQALGILTRAKDNQPAIDNYTYEATSLLVEWVAPLHRAEDLVRSDAVRLITNRMNSLPRAARAAFRGHAYKGHKAAASRNELMRHVTSAADARAVAVEPPVAQVRQAWLTAIWPDTHRKLSGFADTLVNYHERLDTQVWLDRVQSEWDFLVPPRTYTPEEELEFDASVAREIDELDNLGAEHLNGTKVGRDLAAITTVQLTDMALGVARHRIRARRIHQGLQQGGWRIVLESSAQDLRRGAPRLIAVAGALRGTPADGVEILASTDAFDVTETHVHVWQTIVDRSRNAATTLPSNAYDRIQFIANVVQDLVDAGEVPLSPGDSAHDYAQDLIEIMARFSAIDAHRGPAAEDKLGET